MSDRAMSDRAMSDRPGKDRAASDENRGVDPELLKILVCPMTRATLVHDVEAGELVSEAAGVAYPIRDGIPVMLIEEARRL